VLLVIITRLVFVFTGVLSPSEISVTEYVALDFTASANGPLGVWIDHLIKSVTFNFGLSIVIASLLVILNAIQLNTLLIRNASLSENTYIPSAIYVFLMSSSSEFYFFSPALLASAFILISLNYLFYHIKYRGTEENIISTGFGIGIAGLIYTPYLWLYLFVLLVYLVYSNTLRRRYFLMTWGFLLPVIVYWLIFFWQDLGADALSSLGIKSISLETIEMDPMKLLMTLGFGLLISLVGFGSSFKNQGKTNHQILVQSSMSWIGFFGVITAVLFTDNGLVCGLLLIIPLTYFCSQLILSISKNWLKESIFSLLLILGLLGTYMGY